jgi:hypothetical protein
MIEPENKEVSEEILNLTAEDRQILLSLLHEYTDKLTDVYLAKLTDVYLAPENKEVSEEILNLTAENRQILLSLLHEYTDKLTDVCLDIENRLKFYKDWVILSYPMVVLTVLITSQTEQFFPYNLIIAIILYLTILGIFVFLNAPKTQGNIIKNQAKLLAMKLERLIRTTSQFQENVEKSYVHKIELDLRLADAEAALLYYQTLEDKLMKLSIPLKMIAKVYD